MTAIPSVPYLISSRTNSIRSLRWRYVGEKAWQANQMEPFMDDNPIKMNADLVHARDILDKYHDFDDGVMQSFSYFDNGHSRSASMVMYARDHRDPGNSWRHVELTVDDVSELCTVVQYGQFYPILLGVRILDYGDVICLDIDGNYASTSGPASLEEVRQLGDFYAIGKQVRMRELNPC